MEKRFIESNIVIIGDFKPSVFDKLYFIKRNLINEDDFLESTVCTPSFCKIETNDLIIIIESKKIVIILKNGKNKDLRTLADNFISEGSSNVIVVGFNFKWIIFLDEIYSHTKSRFFSNTNTSLNNHFNTDNTAYGTYMSRDFNNSRMKLEVKPNILKQVNNSQQKNILMFDFNFHIESTKNNPMFKESLNDYKSYQDMALKTMNDYE